ncbi:hypothetical protein [Acinetobacter sp. Tol 5]|uniref:hypothetical protein n=1 Tax=Acinetobacter sp. (strain Tol 5) TaxID=710648 RepID=UPI001C74C37D|nr:hypothetical protein [Acinetobacter sp. Tol 5]BCX74770.1 hypothetical protein TOL5_29700 [Acinetobacter sp. Tol 5]
MTVKKVVYDHDDLVEKFSNLINDIQKFLDHYKIKTNVNITKLASFLKALKDLNTNSDCNDQQKANLYYLVIKFLQLQYFLDITNPRVRVKPDEIKKIICGKSNTNDSDQEYNGPFFEISTAVRFVKMTNAETDINLDTDCDIILENEIAVECKYIRSENRISDNIEKAIDQIDKRIEAGLAKKGIIAIDLSNLFDRENVIAFAKSILDRFIYHHEILNNQGVHYGKFKDVKSIINANKGYSDIVGRYLQNEIEMVFLKALSNKVDEKFQTSKHSVAITYEASFGIGFEYNGQSVHFPIRCLSYYMNQNLSEHDNNYYKKFLHLLAVGM